MLQPSRLENSELLEKARVSFEQEKRHYRRLRRPDRKMASAILIKSLADQVNDLQIRLFLDIRCGLQEILLKLGEERTKPSQESALLQRLEFVGKQLAYVKDKLSFLLKEDDFDSAA